MPIIHHSSYQSPSFLAGADMQTILPALFRRVKKTTQRRIRRELPDHDFIDIDCVQRGHRRAIIVSHGMEGSSIKHYVQGMARIFLAQGWDIIAWNLRSCSGETNRLPRFYHAGSSDDLGEVVQFARETNRYDNIALIGFSLGGNVTLKYLGEVGSRIPELSAAATFSVPCCLHASAQQLARKRNRLYSYQFLRTMKKKAIRKHAQHPSITDPETIKSARDINHFDHVVTAPIHGFQCAEDYYRQCSAKFFLHSIAIPTLIVNAQDDPFLAGECYPKSQAKAHPHVYLETPHAGGHVGFFPKKYKGTLWSEQRACEFIHASQ